MCRFGRGYVRCDIADNISATAIHPDPIPDILSPYLKIDQDILLCVDKFDVENTFVSGTITDECIERMINEIEVIQFEGEIKSDFNSCIPNQ